MSVSPPRGVVVVIAVQGGIHKVKSCVDSAARDGLETVVFTDSDAARQLKSRANATHNIRAVAVSSYPLLGVRASLRRRVSGFATRLSSLAFRVTRAARHRLRLPAPANQLLERMGDRSHGVVPRASAVLMNRLLEPLIRVIGFAATKFHHSRVITAEVDRLLKRDVVIGVSCLDDASLLPGWVLARKYPTLPVVAGYPERWDVGVERSKDLFAHGDTW